MNEILENNEEKNKNEINGITSIFIRFQISNMLMLSDSSFEFIFFSKNIEIFLENSNNKIKLKKLIIHMLDDIEKFLSFLYNLNNLCESSKNNKLINSELTSLRDVILKFLSIEDSIKIFIICANYIKDLDVMKKEIGLKVFSLIKNTLPEECLINAYVFNKSFTKIPKTIESRNDNENKDTSEEKNLKVKNKISKHFAKIEDSKEKKSNEKTLDLPLNEKKVVSSITNNTITKIKSNTITVKSLLEYDKSFEGFLSGTGGFLISALDDERKRVKILALNVISSICKEKRFHNFSKNSFTYLLELIHDEEKEVRSKALESLFLITINYKKLPENEINIILNSMYDKNIQIKINLMKILSNIEFTSYFEYEKLINVCIENIYFFDSRNLKKEIVQYLELLSQSISFEIKNENEGILIIIKNENINLLSNKFIVNKLKRSNRNEIGFLINDINKEDYSYIVYLLLLSKGIYYKLSMYESIKSIYEKGEIYYMENIAVVNSNDKRKSFRDILLSKLIQKEKIIDNFELKEFGEYYEDDSLSSINMKTIRQLLDLDFIYPDFFINDMIYFSKLYPSVFSNIMIEKINNIFYH